MAKIKKATALVTALLLCGSLFATAACKDGGNNASTESSRSEESVSSDEGVSSENSSSEAPEIEPTVFTLEEHTWTDWETVTPATCTTDGEEKLVCTDEGCGAVKTRTIKGGHAYGEWTGDLDNLCTADGQLTRTCSNCPSVDVQTVPMRGHAYEDGVCKICDTPFVFPTLAQSPSFVDVWDTSIPGAGEDFNRKELAMDTYYTVEVPATNPDAGVDGVWISLPADTPGQYALLTVGGTNGATIERFDASDYYIPGDENGYIGHASTTHENGETYSIVSCSELHWNEYWRATWRISAESATTVKFIVMKVAPPEWIPKYIRQSPLPEQINNVKANDAPTGFVPAPVDYNDSYYFDEWNGVYRRGTKKNPGEVIYVAIDAEATRLFGEKSFTNIQEDGNNLSLANGTDEQGNYLLSEYHAFLLTEESVNGNAYQNFVNKDGMYPATQELQRFLYLYTQNNRPINIPDDIWNSETEKANKAWLAPCYYYRELTLGTEDHPNVITELGDFEASPALFDIVYFKVDVADETGAPVSYFTLSCEDTNVIVNVNGKSYKGPFSVKFELNATKTTTFYVGALDGSADTFTLTLSGAGEGAYAQPVAISQLGETTFTPVVHLAADGTLGYEAYYEYVVTEACTLTLTTESDAYILFGDQILTDGTATVTVTDDMLGEDGYAVSVYVSAQTADAITATLAKN